MEFLKFYFNIFIFLVYFVPQNGCLKSICFIPSEELELPKEDYPTLEPLCPTEPTLPTIPTTAYTGPARTKTTPRTTTTKKKTKKTTITTTTTTEPPNYCICDTCECMYDCIADLGFPYLLIKCHTGKTCCIRKKGGFFNWGVNLVKSKLQLFKMVALQNGYLTK